MTPSSNNLLVRLSKWASRQEENFLTEALACLLETLRDEEAELAVRILNRITSGILQLSVEKTKSLEIRTQVERDAGKPDIEFRSPDHYILFEVKVESPVSVDQLNRYQSILDESPVPNKGLILLTRHPPELTAPNASIIFCRWFQIAEWIEEESRCYKLKQVSQFLVEQFLGFLREKNMIMEQVTWDLPGGVRAMRTLIDMIYEAAVSCGFQVRPGGAYDFVGVFLDGGVYWCGISFDQPDEIRFHTYKMQIDPEKVEKLGIGEVKNGKGYIYWRRPLPLGSEEIHFFARSKANQRQLLEDFLNSSRDYAKSIQSSQQTIIPDPTFEDAK